MNPPGDLERIRRDVDADLAMVESSRRSGASPDPGPLFYDPTAADAYEVRLRSLHDSVLAVEEVEEALGDP